MNSSAWDKFRKQQATECERLQRLVFGMHGLLAKCRATAPTEIELSALAALLHSFVSVKRAAGWLVKRFRSAWAANDWAARP
jgi:restriction endonuclease Mrr